MTRITRVSWCAEGRSRETKIKTWVSYISRHTDTLGLSTGESEFREKMTDTKFMLCVFRMAEKLYIYFCLYICGRHIVKICNTFSPCAVLRVTVKRLTFQTKANVKNVKTWKIFTRGLGDVKYTCDIWPIKRNTTGGLPNRWGGRLWFDRFFDILVLKSEISLTVQILHYQTF